VYTQLPWIAMVIILLCSILLEHTAAFILLVWCQNCSMLLIFRSSCIFLRFVSVECYAWICARPVRTERIHLSPWMFFVLGWLRKEERGDDFTIIECTLNDGPAYLVCMKKE
jgi:hypothetical protein